MTASGLSPPDIGTLHTNSIVNFDFCNRNSHPVGTGWRRKGEWRWQRPS